MALAMERFCSGEIWVMTWGFLDGGWRIRGPLITPAPPESIAEGAKRLSPCGVALTAIGPMIALGKAGEDS